MKIRRILSVFLLTVLMVSLMLTPQAYALPALEIKAKAAVLVAVLPAAGVRQRGGGHSGGDGIRLP